MSIIDAVSSALSTDTETETDDTQSKGAYWCDDCGVRVLDVSVEAEGLERTDDGTPLCPDCGDRMRFERSHTDGCAC